MFTFKQLISITAIALSTANTDLYHFDTTFKPQFPSGTHTFSAVGIYQNNLYVTQRGNTSIPPVLTLSTLDGTSINAPWGAKDLEPGGAHGIAVESCHYPCALPTDGSDPLPSLRLWVEDFTNHTLTAFTSQGKKIVQIGTAGVAGNGTAPLQFGNIADAAIASGLENPATHTFEASHVYATDGDGGYANRVVKINIPADGTKLPFTEWATGHVFHNPHSITLHKSSELLIVADREQQALKLLDSKNGDVLGTFNCGLKFGPGYGVPFGVRTLSTTIKAVNYDLLFVASMDDPQDKMYQKISILDVSQLSSATGVDSKCTVIQTINIDPKNYSGPHLLGVDERTGDVYATLVADVPLSTVLRFRLNSFVEEE